MSARHLLLLCCAAAGAPHREHDIAWSPDGAELAFLSDAESAGQLQLYVASVASGAARQLTHFAGSLADPQWSPDGKTIAYFQRPDEIRLLEVATGADHILVVSAGFYYDARLLKAMAEQTEATVLVDSAPPRDCAVLWQDWSARTPLAQPEASDALALQTRSTFAELSHGRIVLNIDGPNRSREKHRAIARGNPQARPAVLPGCRTHHQRPRVRPALQGAC